MGGIDNQQPVLEGVLGFKIDKKRLEDPAYVKELIAQVNDYDTSEYVGRAITLAAWIAFVSPLMVLLWWGKPHCLLACKLLKKARILGFSKKSDYDALIKTTNACIDKIEKSKKKAKSESDIEAYDRSIEDLKQTKEAFMKARSNAK